MITISEGPQLVSRSLVVHFGVLLDDRFFSCLEFRPGSCISLRNVVPGSSITSPTMIRSTVGDLTFEGVADVFEVVGKLIGSDRGADGHHPATDVNTYCSGNNGVISCDNRTNSCSDALVNVRHDCDVLEDEGE